MLSGASCIILWKRRRPARMPGQQAARTQRKETMRAVLCFFLLLTTLLCAPAYPADIEASFSPRGKSLELVLSTIQNARESIRVAAYSFTSRPLAEALLAAHKRGVDVKVVADQKANSSRYTAVTFLANQGVPVRLNSRYAIHHHKFMVIDGRHIKTGSFNYSAAAASKNAENVLVVRNEPKLAAQYAKEWERLWNEGRDVEKGY